MTTEGVEQAVVPAAPVQEIVNEVRRWEEWVAGTAPPPPYEELLAQALASVRLLAHYATGHVQHAYALGSQMAHAQERAHSHMLQGLDVLEQAHTVHQAALAAQAEALAAAPLTGATVAPLAVPPPDWGPLVARALQHRQAALDELAVGAGVAALGTEVLDQVQAQAASYAAGPLGPPVPPPGVLGT